MYDLKTASSPQSYDENDIPQYQTGDVLPDKSIVVVQDGDIVIHREADSQFVVSRIDCNANIYHSDIFPWSSFGSKPAAIYGIARIS